MIRTVVWDLGGVVCRFVPDTRLRNLAAATGLPPRTISERIWVSGLDERAECGQLTPDEAYAEVRTALGGTLDPGVIRAIWSTAFVPDADVLHLVAGIEDLPAALLTNNGPILDDCLHAELAGVACHFADVVLSWRLGARKPSAECFERAAATLGRDPSELLLVDDAPANVAAARACGWIAVEYTEPAALARSLRNELR
jgi:FMN phosphatase YigB (HAD superfamily)